MRPIFAIVATLACLPPVTAQRKFHPDKAVQKGCDVLLEMQEGSTKGQWPYEGVYRVGGQIPVGYHVGGTSICARAILEAPGYEQSKERRAAVKRALEFVLEELEVPLMASGFKGGYDVRGWGHTYALIFLLRLHELGVVPTGLEKRVAEKTKWLVDTLVETEIRDGGGWNYSRRRGPSSAASPFMTAPTLQALFRAIANGHSVDESVIERALDALDRGRTKSGGYKYSHGAQSANKIPEKKLRFMDVQLGAVGRMVVTEATLMLAGRGDEKRLAKSVDAFFKHWQHLKDRKQQHGTHIPPGGVAPYYFMFAHRYAAQAISMLPASKRKKQHRKLVKTLAKEVEKNGGWNDRVFDRSRNYGTAFGMLALLQPDLTPVPSWRPGMAAASDAMIGSWQGMDGGPLLHIEKERVFLYESDELKIQRAAVQPASITTWRGAAEAKWQVKVDGDSLVLTRDGATQLLQRVEQRPAKLIVTPLELGTGQPAEDAIPAIREQLRERVEKDQAVRDRATAKEATEEDRAEMRAVDRDNTQWLRGKVAEFGWLDVARFGRKASDNAFLLVQHSGDRELMLGVIDKIEADVKNGELEGDAFCLLYDRLQGYLGKKQLYGSQLSQLGNELVLLPIEDPDGVEARRKEFGMQPLSGYLKLVEKAYGKKVRR